jgi:hypothetical protein
MYGGATAGEAPQVLSQGQSSTANQGTFYAVIAAYAITGDDDCPDEWPDARITAVMAAAASK